MLPSRPALPLAVLLAAVGLSGCADPAPPPAVDPGPPAAPAPPDLSFVAPVFIDELGRGSGEPSLAVGPDGSYWAAAPLFAGDFLWRSRDRGATWEAIEGPGGTPLPTDAPYGGCDADVAVAPDGTIYLAGLECLTWPGQCVVVAVSRDDGETWTTNPDACEEGGSLPLLRSGIDRQWIEAGPGGAAYLYYHGPCCRGRHVVSVSHDHGATWETHEVTDKGGFPGNLVRDAASGALYAFHPRINSPDKYGYEGVAVARSGDDGKTWSHSIAAPLDPDAVSFRSHGLFHLTGDVDAAGNVYVAWATSEPDDLWRVHVAGSRDNGTTWSPPVAASRVPGASVMPWLAARGDGEVAVGWYWTEEETHPGRASPGAAWHVRIARTADFWAPAQAWAEGLANAEPNHRGPICLQGGGCDPNDRDLLDFFEIDFDLEGDVAAVWAHDVDTVENPAAYDQVLVASGRTENLGKA